jgi:hypothetical protein
VGWRVWYLTRVDGVLTLTSRVNNAQWPPRAAMQAGCTLEEHEGAIPRLEGSCGLYASSSPTTLVAARQFGGQPSVVGTVAMWGRVVEHERGARAQFAYPSRLRLVCGICLAKGRGARDPRVVGSRGRGLSAVCRRHRWAVKGGIAADRVRAELLSTYGVDVLPLGDLGASLRVPRTDGRSRGRRSRTSAQLAGAGAIWVARLIVGAWIAFCAVLAIVMTAGIVWGATLRVMHGPLFARPSASSSAVSHPQGTPPVALEGGKGQAHRPP